MLYAAIKNSKSLMPKPRSALCNPKVLCVLCASILAACSPGSVPAPTASPHPTQMVIVSLTFDDGDADNFTLAPALQHYGLHATFYIPSGLVGHPNYMTWDQLKSLQAAGNEIGGHSLDHMKLSGLDTPTLKHEICDDRQNLIDHGFTPVSFAYPFGNYDPNVQAMLKVCGYDGARTIRDGPQKFPMSNPYAVVALPYVVSDTDLSKLQRYVNGARNEGADWVVLIFHHVCDFLRLFCRSPGCDKQVHPLACTTAEPWYSESGNFW